ncbi:GtrA family protein [Roseovarius sp. B08]|uniref:GtrA family protein n=1 Tax=Roseovarius sp. B08 TaxID=3449223 RepID=UPI003EDC41E2
MTRPGKTFPRFLAVGSVGFAIDAGVLWALMTLGGDAYLSRCISFALAMSVTWALNRRWTFRGAHRTALHREYIAYALVQGLGIAINFAVYALMLMLLGTGPILAVMALACGSGVALAANYLGLKHAVFRPAAPPSGT